MAGSRRTLSVRIFLDDIRKTFTGGGGKVEVLRGVTLEIPSGTTAAITGPSGSGKTTLLGIMAGLEPPTSGRVLLGETDVTGLTEEERAGFRARNVGFVFQTFQLLPALTAVENVQLPLELLPRRERPSRHEIRDRAEALLDRVGVAHRLHHLPSQLSGGEQQRVAVARAFVARPRILFADEPTGNLDAESGARVVDGLEELNRAEGTTLVTVTHDLTLAARSDRVFRFRAGELEPEGVAS